MQDPKLTKAYNLLKKQTPKQVDELTFLIESESSTKTYKVQYSEGWKCTCPYYENRLEECKHIVAVKLWLGLME